MTHSLLKTSWVGGELAPSIWGSIDYAKFPAGCSAMRNCFVNYRMGGSSRAGTKFVGFCLPDGSGPRPWPVTFQFNVNVSYILEFGNFTMRVVYNGGYVTETPKAITGASQANPCVLQVPAHGWNNGDWVAISDVGGMTELNGRTAVVANAGTNDFTLRDTFGDSINSIEFSAYTSGGTVARIFTATSPYSIADLSYLKTVQSADVMTIDCVNTITGVEYPVYELSRNAPDNWAFALANFDSAPAAPASASAVASVATGTTTYQYVVTSIDSTGQESVASPIAEVTNSVDIATTAGSITVTWANVVGVVSYNIYKAPAGVQGGTVPIGSSFGFAGSANGTQWTDQNVIQNFARTPPLHLNPFARGQLQSAEPSAAGAGYAQNTTSVTINTTTGTGGIVLPVVVAGAVVAYIVATPGKNYLPSDTMTVVGAGAGATGTLSIGAQTGTYPGVPAYFQQRMVHAASLNAPDTYDMSKPGTRNNFDAGDPPVDDDALEGTPWGQQVNGIQWMLPITGGLLCMTGLSIWKVSGSASIQITPSSQDAEPQEYNGISATVGPIRIKQNVLYVQDKGSLVNDLEFNFYNNTFTGTDISVQSNHLFDGFRITQWDWAQEPWKLAWAVRDDGRLLSLAYVKDQKISGWSRHDTNGIFTGVAVASERPVDAPYFVVKRYIPGKRRWAYCMERMDNRKWPNAEAVWAVDCGLALDMPTPDATLQAGAASGTGIAFTTDAAVFDGVTTGVVGQVIRTGGGKATVTAYVSSTQITGDITVPITATIPNDPNERPLPSVSGQWSITTPVSEVTNLSHLEGFEVYGLADGAVIQRQVVTNARIPLQRPASAVVVGLPFLPQLQTMHAEIPGGETIQGDRKRVYSSKLRLERSRGVEVGTNQPNASAQQNQAEIEWGQGTQFVGKMIPYEEPQNVLLPGDPLALLTGDVNVNIDGDFDLTGMVAFQQPNPLPMNVLMNVSEIEKGDTSG